MQPERTSSGVSPLASGPDCGTVSSATERWNAKAREGRNRRAYPLAPKPDARQDPHPRRGSPPGMVGRE
ncbi:hypothetical protein [Natronoglomus mannanivorans]|uniref:Uncharacterized protein n=1 Tax=Natronoglomus mannanivorans TaxID=2979990 RepID=A0AAP2Z400_9EURY|nr:hypothetical protein [Halobacteria archaeon AArc-xg1-1]